MRCAAGPRESPSDRRLKVVLEQTPIRIHSSQMCSVRWFYFIVNKTMKLLSVFFHLPVDGTSS